MDALEASCDTLLSSLGGLAEGGLEARQFTALDHLRRTVSPAATRVDPLAAADAEEQVAGWLRRNGVEDPWQLAGQLADVGADVPWCEQVSEVVPSTALVPALTWVASALTSQRLLGEVREATRCVTPR